MDLLTLTKRLAACAAAAVFVIGVPLRADSGAKLSFLHSPSLKPFPVGVPSLMNGFAQNCCSVVAADFNRDGKADIAVSYGQADFTVFLSDGKGGFARKDWPLDLGTGVVLIGLVASADFNGDGIPDLVGMTEDAFLTAGTVVLLGRGDGSFGAPVMISDTEPRTVGDFNGDGKLDLLVRPHPSIVDTGFAVSFGNGDGTFQPPGPRTPQPAGDFSWAVVGDFNQDGKLDVVETTFRPSDSRLVYLWLGKGDGTFDSVTTIPLGASSSDSSYMVTGDFNRDGHLDLAVLVENDDLAVSDVVILLGDGKGGLTLGGSYPVPGEAPLVAADFRHTGVLDLAVGFTVLAGNGDGTFAAAQTFGQYLEPSSIPGGIKWVAAGDFNGDGKLDLVGPGVDGKQVSVLLNNTPGFDASVNPASAADYGAEVAPGSAASIFGSGFAMNTVRATGLDLPTSLGNVSVRVLDVNGVERLAGLSYVSPSQVNFVVPPGTAPGFAVFNMTDGRALPDGTRSTWVAPIAPAFFTVDGSGQGAPAATAVRVMADGSQVPVPVVQCTAGGACSLVPIDLSGPGRVYLTVYGTGFRQADAAGCDTTFPLGFTPVDGGEPQLRVTYVGPQPTMAGLDQINILLPSTLPNGAIKIRCGFSHALPSQGVAFARASFDLAVR